MSPLRLLVLFAAVALATGASAAGVALNPSVRYEFTDCASGGSAAQTVVAGTYLLRITDADTTVCIADSAATCASGGDKFPSGTVMLLTVGGTSKSLACRSSASTGDLILTQVR